jgi:NAD(P)-dependent dehydrogenase (short-subunit alcohol dehydrogenase family)
MMTNEAIANLFALDGRVALITGASGGIGGELARGLAQAGACVALNGRSAAKLAQLEHNIRADGGEAYSFVADVSDVETIPTLVDDVLRRRGRIDVLVNCAGTNQRMPIAEVTPAVYDEIMATNLRGLYFLSQAVARVMIGNNGGKIINIGSLTASVGLQNVSVYGMTKSALAQLTKTMAVEWAAHNIQVNCLCPGFVATELTTPLWDDAQRRQWMLDRLPIKRAGQPADLLGMTLLLAGHASDYMTGQTVYVDGGFTAGSQW